MATSSTSIPFNIEFPETLSDSSDSENSPPTKKQRKSSEWLVVSKFNCKEDAEKFLGPGGVYYNKYRTEDGDIIRFNCRNSRKCAAKRRLLLLEKVCPDFVKYFQEEHLDSRSNWYEGYAIGYPSTSNGVESTNANIKKYGTFREKLPMGEFFEYLLKQGESWSFEREEDSRNCKMFSETPTISLAMETKAYNWVQSKPSIGTKTIQDDVEYIYYIAASGTAPLKYDDVQKYLRLTENKSWKSFETYKSTMSRLWLVRFLKTNWTSSTCTCPWFMKHHTCKHILGLAIVNKLYEIRPEAKDIPLGKKRARGRPSKN